MRCWQAALGWWAEPNVRFQSTGTKRLHHPIVCDLKLSYETLKLPADHRFAINVYTVAASNRFGEALRLVGSWAATPDHAEMIPSMHDA